MLPLCCLRVNGASGEVYPGGYNGSRYLTSSDNLQMEVLNFGDDFIAWYNESLLNFPYVLSFYNLTGSYYVGSDNVEKTYEIADLGGNLTSVSSSSSIDILRLDFGPCFLPLSSENATIIRFFLDDLGDDSFDIEYHFSVSGYHLQFLNDEWVQIPFSYSNTLIHTFSSDDPLFDFNYIDEFGDDLFHYTSNSILNISSMGITIINDFYDGNIDYHYIYYRKLNTNLTTSSQWLSGYNFDISDFGTNLLNGVTNFLAFEVYPGFSLLDLLYLIIGIPLLIAILKLFLGG